MSVHRTYLWQNLRTLPSGVVDHFAISVENFNRDAVTEQLKQHGLTPQQNVQFGFQVKDPDGAVVQSV